VIPDSYITESRLKVVRELPWPIPALVIVGMTDEDLDHLAAAPEGEYWTILNVVVTRMQPINDREETRD
jgi:hypothetical protein